MLLSLMCLVLSCSAPASQTTTSGVFYRIFNSSINQSVDIPSGNATKFLNSMNTSAPTVFYIHGWRETCSNDSAIEICSAILSRQEGHNVCCLDWSILSLSDYPSAASNTAEVATIFSEDIKKMCEMGFDLKKLFLYGFSLGAHVAGGTGNKVQEAGHGNISGITALDPALPLMYPFETCLNCRHIRSTDAEMVWVIHTSAESFGTLEPTGKCDIYPNYGTQIQKGCPIFTDAFDAMENTLKIYRCSHDRAPQLMAESIRNKSSQMCVSCDSPASFAAGLCSGNEKFTIGMNMSKNMSGLYYYMTNAASPYGTGIQGTNPSNT